MQAIIQDRYGSAEVLEARDIDRPAIGDDEVLVRVRAASVHVGDWILMTGVPYVMRMGTGLSKPKNPVPGTDIAGTVEAVGPQVHSLRPGDEVFGWCTGAFAEYAHAPEDQLLKKPANLTFEQAAAVGVSASTALQLLRRREGAARAKGPDQRGLGRGWHIRRADRQGVWRRGDRGVQHQEP
jgi:NADPH:quinone reductase-like Zn-dependent oxidoreductase